MTDAEAEAERKSIEDELATEKGIDPKTGKPIAKEPVAQEEEEPVKEPEEKPKEEEDGEPAKEEKSDEEEADEGQKPAKERTQRYIPLPKFQELKKSAAEKDAEIARLKGEIDRSNTEKARDAKIKAYAEKHSMTEEAVRDLFAINEPEKPQEPAKPAVEPAVDKTADQKKQEAETAYTTELAGLLEEVPEAKGHEDEIRKAAFKKGNETKSLYEIFHREIKPSIIPKKKTGEQSRGAAGRESDKAPDFEKIQSDLASGKTGVLDKLSGEEQDKYFAWIEKKGSRYTRP